jgi:hypothetical protein
VRVTVEHRERTSGVLQNRKEYYIDCRVEFSEEERSIIKERDLYRNGFPIRTSTPLPGQASFVGTMIMRLVSPFMIVGGIIYGIAGGGGLPDCRSSGASVFSSQAGSESNDGISALPPTSNSLPSSDSSTTRLSPFTREIQRLPRVLKKTYVRTSRI